LILRDTVTTAAPKILYITYGLPFPPHRGARLRNFHLIRQAALGFRIHVIALVEQPETQSNLKELSKICEQVEVVTAPRGLGRKLAALLFEGLRPRHPLATAFYYSSELSARIRKAALPGDVRLIQIDHSLLAPHIAAVPDELPIKKILCFHNLAEHQYRSMLNMDCGLVRRGSGMLKYMLMKNWEARIAERFDHCVTVSENERAALIASNPRLAVSVIENGVDTQQIPFLPPAKRNDSLLFVGNMEYAPNQDALFFFCTRILPRLRARFPRLDCAIAGAAPSETIRDLCRTHGLELIPDPQDLTPCYREAAICIVPLRSGGGTRLKILEAMAYGRPVVSTPIGGEGLNVTSEQDILLGATPDEFAGQISRLVESPELAARLARNARIFVERHHDWQEIGQKQRLLYEAMLQMPAPDLPFMANRMYPQNRIPT
jgi:polysaccharide biosynthesis protein PslH